MPTNFLENSLVKWFKIKSFKIFQKHMPLATVPFKFNLQNPEENQVLLNKYLKGVLKGCVD